MGKRKQNTKYEHNHTYNPRARESDDRKIVSLKNLELKRLQSCVTKQRDLMKSYIAPESRKKYKIDPLYDLKGAARVAREFYRPPDYKEDVEPVDLITLNSGKIWNHVEGPILLKAMMKLGVALHNEMNKSKDAIKTFKEMIELDRDDHLLARHRLLRCYLDKGEALKARELLDKYPGDNSSCFAYNRALIEFIALFMEESDASEEVRDDMLRKAIQANPHTVWAIAYHEVFTDCVSHLDKLEHSDAPPGSIEDAFVFLDVDVPLWTETDGLIDYVRDFLEANDIAPPLVEVLTPPEPASADEEKDVDHEHNSEEQEVVLTPEEMHAMFVDMFATAMELVESGEGQRSDEEGE